MNAKASRSTKSAKKPKLRGRTKELATKYIAEEVRTGQYKRAQAVAIGISRAKAQVKKERRRKATRAIMRKRS